MCLAVSSQRSAFSNRDAPWNSTTAQPCSCIPPAERRLKPGTLVPGMTFHPAPCSLAPLSVQQACRPSSVPTLRRAVTINLRQRLPTTSSGQPEGSGRAPLTPSYLALLRAGFSRPPRCREAGGLLPHHFTLTPVAQGGMFLCHFPSDRSAWELPSALPVWSSDLPPPAKARSGHPAYWTSSILSLQCRLWPLDQCAA